MELEDWVCGSSSSAIPRLVFRSRGVPSVVRSLGRSRSGTVCSSNEPRRSLRLSPSAGVVRATGQKEARTGGGGDSQEKELGALAWWVVSSRVAGSRMQLLRGGAALLEGLLWGWVCLGVTLRERTLGNVCPKMSRPEESGGI